MSAAVENYRDEMEATYAVDFTRNHEPIKARKRFPEYRRTGGAPTRVSGLHCRRSKRWTWGSGRGARLQNLRAFAGALALLVAGMASNAFAVTLDMVSIGNVGNAPYQFSPVGDVNYAYSMSRTETTNAQYVEFLNAVGASNPNGIYNAWMGSNTNGGIVQIGFAGKLHLLGEDLAPTRGSGLRQRAGQLRDLVLGGPLRELASQRPVDGPERYRGWLLHAGQCDVGSACGPKSGSDLRPAHPQRMGKGGFQHRHDEHRLHDLGHE